MMVDQTSIFDFIEDDVPVAAVEKPTFTPYRPNERVYGGERVQGTGVKDSKGNEVYDGSILDVTYYKQQLRNTVHYDARRGLYVTRDERGEETYSLCILASCGWVFEVVGHVLEKG